MHCPRATSGLCLLLLFLFLAFPIPLSGQTTSVIEGTVSDPEGRLIAGAEITIRPVGQDREIKVLSGDTGVYRILAVQPGTYQLRVSKSGFATQMYEGLTVTLNRVVTFNISLTLSAIEALVTVSAETPFFDNSSSSSGATILPQQINQMPLNGRNYLDLLQLVPGVAINRQVDGGSDRAVPILGERGGNTVFLIDGMPNNNIVDGGPSAPFDQDSILEFQVITAGYKAEFGHGSGGVVNVVTKSGTNEWHGLLSLFHRNRVLDSSNVKGKSTPFLLRWDPSGNLGGPLVSERVFVFGSLQRVREIRHLNFNFPTGIPDFLRVRENTFDRNSQLSQTRGFVRFDEQLGRHHLTQQMNLSNTQVAGFLPLSQATSLPSTRTNSGSRQLLIGIHDTITLGEQSNPYLLHAYLQYRDEPSQLRPTNTETSPVTTLFNMFSNLTTGRLTGNLGQVRFGAGFNSLLLIQQYTSAGFHLNRLVNSHDLKVGWDFGQTRVDGHEPDNQLNQLFATISDFSEFGPVNAGVYVLSRVGGPTRADNEIRLRNFYDGLFVQDDWKIAKRLTLNIGLRWDHDSRFPNGGNFSPRLGAAWSPLSKMLITASWGMFYDKFRLGLARDIPGLGGANLFRSQTISYPRLFYGNPSTLPRLFGLCLSSNLTDAQIQASGGVCPTVGQALFGIDHLNTIVASGHAPIPASTVVTLNNVQGLTGLNPQQFTDAASTAVGRQPGFFFWGPLGHLTMNFPVPQLFLIPITVDPGFKTPHTQGLHLGLQQEISTKTVIQVDYHHRDIRSMLGVRTANLAFEARMPGRSGQLQPGTGTLPILSYGPWYHGRYDAASIGLRQRLSRGVFFEAFYTWAHAVDNALNSSFVSEVQTGRGAGSLGSLGPTDSFVGVPPLVIDPVTRQTNANGSFIASNGNPVPQAGQFYNGADLDRGPSDLALNHTLLTHGIVMLPWQFQVSGIFRAQSGFHFSASPLTPVDVDGDGLLNGIDFLAGRNHFVAPSYINFDARFSKRFSLGEKVRAQVMVEFFNLLNRANPAAVQQFKNLATPLGTPIQNLPGREGQLGLRFEF
jgi:outer membrane receptor protein involved in Fe transport